MYIYKPETFGLGKRYIRLYVTESGIVQRLCFFAHRLLSLSQSEGAQPMFVQTVSR